MMKSLKAGFTLAEVLTTLMVIGVVAAMTIPTLMNSTGDQQTKVATKKAASVLSQAVQLLTAKELDCTGTNTAGSGNDELSACMSQVIAGTAGENGVFTTSDGMIYKFMTPDDTFVDFTTTCNESFGSFNASGNCAVVVDVNGLKKGTDGFGPDNNQANIGNAALTSSGFGEAPEAGKDVVAFSLCAAGVRPVAIAGASNYAYGYMYGSTDGVSAGSLAAASRWCCDTCPNGTTNAGKPLASSCVADWSGGSCGDKTSVTDASTKVTECSPAQGGN